MLPNKVRRQGGLRGPHTPTAPGVSPLDPFCDAEVCFSRRLSACKFWGTERKPTGAMKIRKKPGEQSPPAFFRIFPGCFASGWRRSAAGPWAGASGASNSQSYNLLCQRVFACFVKGRRQSLRPYGPAPFTQGRLFLHPSAGFSSPSGILCQQENVC